MSAESDGVRVWLVERDYNQRDLIILKYATLEGDRLFRRELAAQIVDEETATAARDVSPDDLESVDDPDLRERYADEAARVAAEHDPGDAL